MSPEPARSGRVAAAVVVGLVLLLFRRAVFRGEVFFERDIHFFWFTQVESFVRGVAGGALPLWDPTVGFGQPLLADPSAQVAYPLSWLHFVLRPWVYYTVFVVLHSVFSGLGVYALSRRLGMEVRPAILAAALWICGGPWLSLVNLYHHFAGAAWIPWVVLAAHHMLERLSLRAAVAWGAAMAAQVLAGSLDMCFSTCLLTIVLVFLKKVAFDAAREHPGRLLSCVGLGALFGLALSAILWVPTLEVVARSARSDLPEYFRTYWSVHPLRLLHWVLPFDWIGLPMSPHWRDALNEGRGPFLFSLYASLPALGLALGALVRRNPTVVRLFVLLTLLMMFALGRHGVLYLTAMELLPWLRTFRYPEKALIPAAFCWALLAGWGLDAWEKRAGTARAWTVLGALPLALGALGIVAFTSMHFDAGSIGGGMQFQARRLLVSAAACAAVLAIGVAAVRRRPSWASWAMGAVLAADLLASTSHLNTTGPSAIFTSRPEALPAVVQADGRRMYAEDYFQTAGRSHRTLGRDDAYRMARLVRGWPYSASVAWATRATLLPSVPGAWGVEASYDTDVRGLYPSALETIAEAMRITDSDVERLRLWRLGAVGRVVALHEKGLEALTPVGAFDSILVDPVRVFAVPGARPRWYVAGRARIVPADADALATLLHPGFDPDSEIVLPAENGAAGGWGRVQLVEKRADRLVLDVEIDEAPAYLVAVDAYDPGWKAAVDGQPTELLRANLAFRAVRVAPGRHRVEMVYRPRSAAIGAVVTASAGLAALLLLFRPPAA